MTGTVHTYTVIHAGDAPYGIAIVEVGEQRRTARVDGDLEWLAIGARAELAPRDAGGLTATPTA